MKSDKANKPASKTSQIIIQASKYLFFLMLGLSLFGLAYVSVKYNSDPLTYDDPIMIENWDVTLPDGSKITAGSSYRNPEKTEGTYVATSVLPGDIKEDSHFCLIIGGDTEVYINGELRKDFVGERDFDVPGGIVKRFYFVVPLEVTDAGAEVKIVREGTARNGNVYQETFVCTSSGLYNFLMGNYGLSLNLSEILAIFSIVIFIISIAMKIIYKRKIAMMYGALSIFIIAAWIITNSYIYPFVFHSYHVDGVINYLLCMMIPFCLLYYLDILQKGRYRKPIIGVLIVSFISFFFWSLLHFNGIFPFTKALVFINIILGLQILVVAVIFVIDTIKGKVKEYKFTAIGFALFLICGFAELILLNFFVTLHDEIPMLLGLAILLTMSVVQQIDDLKRINDERLKAIALSDAKTNFLANMSHEIRTPINAILGMNEMILRENTDSNIEEYASSVQSSGRMLLMLVNDVLDFSKIEAGKMELNKAEFSFSNLLRDIYPMLKERADEKKLDLKVTFLRKIPDGQISDEFRIKQVLINLINNAIKYTDSGSVMLLADGESIDDKHYMLKLTVKDTGRGISEEGQENLFDAFSRADLKKNGSIEGTGLGLAIVKNIVDGLKGEISLTSKLGEGSEFTVKIPVEVFDETPAKEDFMVHVNGNSNKNYECDYKAPDAKILAVDDNASNLKIVTLFLKRAGIVPDSADSGRKAIEMCKNTKYDLILMDHMMPEMDGLETLSKIKEDEESLNKDTTVIVLTANAVAGSKAKYMEAGFADYLTKPIDSALLEQTVKKYLPEEKVLPPDKPAEKKVKKSLKARLTSIEGLDYDTAMRYTHGDEEILEDAVDDIAANCDKNINLMKKCLEENDFDGYSCQAHAIKGLMAMIGLKEFSQRAMAHEFAGKDEDIDFIKKDCEEFFATYRDICDKLIGK